MKIIVIDNYDSFTYNLVHYIEKIPDCKVDVFRNNEISLSEIEKYDKIILSPGPGLPSETYNLFDIIKFFAGRKPIFGVCLGMQAIAEVFGGKLENLLQVYHGIASEIKIIKPKDIIFSYLPDNFLAGRYHSWVVSRKKFPKCLKITAIDNEKNIMALSHKTFDIKAVQFHPESILTKHGELIINNFIKKV